MWDDPFFNFNGDSDPWWANTINRGIDVIGAWSSRSPYYSPNDPRYGQRGVANQPPPTALSQPYSQRPDEGAGIRLSNQTLILIGIGALAFMLGSRRK